MGFSQTRDRTHVLFIGRQILNHWTTREVQNVTFLIDIFKSSFRFAAKLEREGTDFPYKSPIVVQSLSRVRLFVTPWTAARQAFLTFTSSRSLLKLMSTESVMPCNHLILCRPLLLQPSIFSSIRVFSNESALHIRWPKYQSFSFSIRPSSEHPGLISLRIP